MITLDDVAKSFGQKKVLDGVSLTIAPASSMVVIGGSGTGKSVLLKSILGLIQPDRGRIKVDGQTQNGHNSAAFLDQFGMLFQGAALFDSLPIWENIAFRLLRGPRKMRKEDAKELAIEKLKRVGLGPDVADLFPSELSGGMQKRAGLARAIAANPKIIFFDEPTTGLDPIMSGVINDLIRGIVDELGVTAVTITHDMGSVRAIADQVAMLYQGRVEWTGAVSQLDHCGNAVVEQFITGSATGPIDTVR